jgi:hypothetical protein
VLVYATRPAVDEEVSIVTVAGVAREEPGTPKTVLQRTVGRASCIDAADTPLQTLAAAAVPASPTTT